MSLLLADNNDVLSVATDASINDLDPFTLLMWVNLTAAAGFADRVAYKTGELRAYNLNATPTWHLERDRASSAAAYQTQNDNLPANEWRLLAGVFDSSGGAGEVMQLYYGDLTTAAVEASYSSTQDGSGAVKSDAAEGWAFVSGVGQSNTLKCHIAYAAIVADALTLGQVRSWQWRPRVLPETRAFLACGFQGASSVTDLSGNGNDASGTGTVVSDHIPLPPPFGFDLGWQGLTGASGPAPQTLTPDPVTLPLAVAAPTVQLGALTLTPGPVVAPMTVPDPAVAHTLSLTPDPVASPVAAVDPAVQLGALTLTPDPVAVPMVVPPATVLGVSSLMALMRPTLRGVHSRVHGRVG